LLLKIALHSKGKFLQQLTRHSVRLLVGDFLVIREFLVLRYVSFDTLTEFPHSGKSIIYHGVWFGNDQLLTKIIGLVGNYKA